jgi:hypothetical protein
MQAQFRILDGTQVVNQYSLEYGSTKELNDLFHEARKVWAEYMVEVDMEWGTMGFSHTYAEQIKKFGK